MPDINFIKQRIAVYAGREIDPNSDIQVKSILYNMGIKLPQKRDLNESLNSSNNEHEIISLISRYRNLTR